MKSNFSIKNKFNEDLVGDIFISNNSNKIIIFIPGYGGKRTGGPKAMAEMLAKQSLNCLIFDLSGSGDSEGKFSEKTIKDWQEDTISVIDYIKSKGFEEIALVGTSMGGTIAFEVAARTNISSLVLRATVPDYHKRIMDKYAEKNIDEVFKEKMMVWSAKKVLTSSVKEIMNHNLYKIIDKVKCPILIIHGDKDLVVDVNLSIDFAKQLPNSKLEIVKGADHSTSVDGDYSMLHKILLDWFSKWK